MFDVLSKEAIIPVPENQAACPPITPPQQIVDSMLFHAELESLVHAHVLSITG